MQTSTIISSDGRTVIPEGPAALYDQWIRREFVEYNTALEEAYFAAGRELVTGRRDLEEIKEALAREGAELIGRLAGDGSVPADPEERYELLGRVGFYLAALRRHEVEAPDPSAGVLSQVLGTSLGVAPRYVFAHQSLYNRAVRDAYPTFTSLPDEHVFVTYNGLGVLAYQRAAAALAPIPALGVSSPLATYLLEGARAALDDVLAFNRALSGELDPGRFFLNIRPYFKPYRVGGVEYRGVNAGDFSGINEIDLLLGLCDARDPFYQRVLAEKRPYVPPEDQGRLSRAVMIPSLLDAFLAEMDAGPLPPRLRRNAELFLAVCRSHGAAYTFHHHRLVKPFLETPAQNAEGEVTSSGPPLEAVIAMLDRLSDLRSARRRPGLTSASASLDRLRRALDS
ncbi:monodechloroaminopyrrolnitrin synthase PrnB family protein [Bailinhaonella thermotolerans]|uniref:DUF1864 family protein n=1 Tax=Bailinhaonella thermotolerans TaxID=1070861 RepID=A0A3A4BCG6_9ACTN|nr:monodechloroaminopyrrolnitrin synthase PrnB family protein [Bailinhaonella thermotolerans]RJL35796.1 DUF1864 family protein [Bailinhaonella thermotolerans]